MPETSMCVAEGLGLQLCAVAPASETSTAGVGLFAWRREEGKISARLLELRSEPDTGFFEWQEPMVCCPQGCTSRLRFTGYPQESVAVGCDNKEAGWCKAENSQSQAYFTECGYWLCRECGYHVCCACLPKPLWKQPRERDKVDADQHFQFDQDAEDPDQCFVDPSQYLVCAIHEHMLVAACGPRSHGDKMEGFVMSLDQDDDGVDNIIARQVRGFQVNLPDDHAYMTPIRVGKFNSRDVTQCSMYCNFAGSVACGVTLNASTQGLRIRVTQLRAQALPPRDFVGGFISLPSGLLVGLTDCSLCAMSSGSWHRILELPLAGKQWRRIARGPVGDQVVVFSADDSIEHINPSSIILLRASHLVTIGDVTECPAGGSQGSITEAAKHVLITSVVSVPLAGLSFDPKYDDAQRYLLPTVLRSPTGYLFFFGDGTVHYMPDDSIVLKEQGWQPPSWAADGHSLPPFEFCFKRPSSTDSQEEAGTDSMKVHMHILQRYAYFRSMCARWSEQQTSKVVVEDFSMETFRDLLNFVTSGRLRANLALSELSAILLASNKYIMADATAAILARLHQYLCSQEFQNEERSPAKDVADILLAADAMASAGAFLLQDLIQAIVRQRPKLLEQQEFIALMGQRGPGILCSLVTTFRQCATVDLGEVGRRTYAGKLTTQLPPASWAVSACSGCRGLPGLAGCAACAPRSAEASRDRSRSRSRGRDANGV